MLILLVLLIGIRAEILWMETLRDAKILKRMNGTSTLNSFGIEGVSVVVVACWTAGQQIKQSNQGHDSS